MLERPLTGPSTEQAMEVSPDTSGPSPGPPNRADLPARVESWSRKPAAALEADVRPASAGVGRCHLMRPVTDVLQSAMAP
jgi:hypothetical protein